MWPERLLEHLPLPDRVLDPLLPLAPQRGAGALGGDQLAELLERDAEQLAQPEQLAEPLDVLLAVGAVGAGLALLLGGEQPDLLVVADRPRRGPGELGDVADPVAASRSCRAPGPVAGSSTSAARRSSGRGAGRSSETPAPISEVAASTQSAVCMLWMNGSSCALERPEARPEKILKRTFFGTAAVTIASTKAIEITAPVFCSIVRAPAAIPRRLAGTVPIIAAVLGELNIPEPMPTRPSQSVLSQ